MTSQSQCQQNIYSRIPQRSRIQWVGESLVEGEDNRDKLQRITAIFSHGRRDVPDSLHRCQNHPFEVMAIKSKKIHTTQHCKVLHIKRNTHPWVNSFVETCKWQTKRSTVDSKSKIPRARVKQSRSATTNCFRVIESRSRFVYIRVRHHTWRHWRA